MSTRVAVIIPCFNDGELVGEAVRSVSENEPVEIVVVDDGSERETLAELEKLRADGVRVVIHERNMGVGAARTTGLTGTSAPFVFPLDADDLAEPGALARMADALDARPDAAVCYGDYLEFGSRQLVRAVPESLDPYRIAYVNEYPPSALFRRSALTAAGEWNNPDQGYEDWSLWMALAESGAIGLCMGPGVITYKRRLHGERRYSAERRQHRHNYKLLRRRHPQLFASVRANRRRSDLSTGRKILYPFVYGGRRRFAFERPIKTWLDRRGIWTLRR